MTLKNTRDRWGAISQSLHWTIVVLLLAVAVIGLAMGELPRSPKYFWVYTAHKSIGITILALMLLRWLAFVCGAPRRCRHAEMAGAAARSPTGRCTPSPWRCRCRAGCTTAAGCARSAGSACSRCRWWGRMNGSPCRARAHELLFLLLVALVAPHVGAALYHHLFLRDDTLHGCCPP